jgi:DNA invertase Pin-like site-specific DNA recombinase
MSDQLQNQSSTIKNVYGYIRVSTETQADKGYGLETQQQAIINYCEINKLNLLRIFSDEGISGAIGDKDDLSSRPALCELLNVLNGTNTIVVMNTSRLWRDEGAKVLVCKSVRNCKGEIISIEQPRYSLYSKDPQEFLFNSMMEILDQYDRMMINKRLAKGKTTKAKSGDKPCGRTPFGYQWSYDRKNIEVNPEEAQIVKLIFTCFRNLYGFQQIANYLNEKHHYNRNNKVWSRQSIRAILKNEFYIGILSHQGKEIKGNHERLIDDETWKFAQGLMRSRDEITQEDMDDLHRRVQI